MAKAGAIKTREFAKKTREFVKPKKEDFLRQRDDILLSTLSDLELNYDFLEDENLIYVKGEVSAKNFTKIYNSFFRLPPSEHLRHLDEKMRVPKNFLRIVFQRLMVPIIFSEDVHIENDFSASLNGATFRFEKNLIVEKNATIRDFSVLEFLQDSKIVVNKGVILTLDFPPKNLSNFVLKKGAKVIIRSPSGGVFIIRRKGEEDPSFIEKGYSQLRRIIPFLNAGQGEVEEEGEENLEIVSREKERAVYKADNENLNDKDHNNFKEMVKIAMDFLKKIGTTEEEYLSFIRKYLSIYYLNPKENARFAGVKKLFKQKEGILFAGKSFKIDFSKLKVFVGDKKDFKTFRKHLKILSKLGLTLSISEQDLQSLNLEEEVNVKILRLLVSEKLLSRENIRDLLKNEKFQDIEVKIFEKIAPDFLGRFYKASHLSKLFYEILRNYGGIVMVNQPEPNFEVVELVSFQKPEPKEPEGVNSASQETKIEVTDYKSAIEYLKSNPFLLSSIQEKLNQYGEGKGKVSVGNLKNAIVEAMNIKNEQEKIRKIYNLITKNSGEPANDQVGKVVMEIAKEMVKGDKILTIIEEIRLLNSKVE